MAFNSKFEEEVALFVSEYIVPHAIEMDETQNIPDSVIKNIADRGYFGACVKSKYGGLDLNTYDMMSLHKIMAKGHGSVENMLTVTGMVTQPIQRFGSKEIREKWLPKIASGEKIGAIALTEPNAGSDLRAVDTYLTDQQTHFTINGVKRWITLGQIADFFLVLCKLNNKTIAVIVEKDTHGVKVKPITNMLGLRANMLAEIEFTDCKIPKENAIGNEIDGVSTAINFGLDEGRYTTACGSYGIAELALEETLKHLREKDRLNKHQLVQKLLTEMIVEVESAKSFCTAAAGARETFDFSMIRKTLLAKYVASKAATNVSSKAIQILGAKGCHLNSSFTERLYRDAKIMELIEGSTEIHEVLIAKEFLYA
ncbi:acyl-CoA dehydrogenase family protein [Tenacibaculum tangerinum]|uniref:Acyl-CoA dehydrogenase family protein n=1 Tax=Tenacibaculum tangerinum TaxID=3038772 RepID=A0ABY8KYX8_9FLAO|nr:acyl-CoA dehydrogenase family protein [Tenacibaculum tangerinum]WGH74230.1 acyl-CoA dehydrogenase family protein [Tenacibaculum tangerinum]